MTEVSQCRSVRFDDVARIDIFTGLTQMDIFTMAHCHRK
jgi:hypothetical protein